MRTPQLPNHIEVKSIDGITQVYLNGEQIRGVRSIEFSQSVDTLPMVNLELVSNATLDMELNDDCVLFNGERPEV